MRTLNSGKIFNVIPEFSGFFILVLYRGGLHFYGELFTKRLNLAHK
jgi:hypothetical protein